MNSNDLEIFRRAVRALHFESKTFLNRQEIDRLVQELNLAREYRVADYVRSLDPASVAGLLR
jgi:hypothetical protein